jgi:hypothetical protein
VLVRIAIAGLLSAGLLSACSDDGAEIDPYCAKLIAVSDRLANAQRELFESDAGSGAALTRIADELRGLQPDAPAAIRRSLTALTGAFQQAEEALRHPSKQSRQALADAAEVLSTDGRKVTAYATAKCEQPE